MFEHMANNENISSPVGIQLDASSLPHFTGNNIPSCYFLACYAVSATAFDKSVSVQRQVRR